MFLIPTNMTPKNIWRKLLDTIVLKKIKKRIINYRTSQFNEKLVTVWIFFPTFYNYAPRDWTSLDDAFLNVSPFFHFIRFSIYLFFHRKADFSLICSLHWLVSEMGWKYYFHVLFSQINWIDFTMWVKYNNKSSNINLTSIL